MGMTGSESQFISGDLGHFGGGGGENNRIEGRNLLDEDKFTNF